MTEAPLVFAKLLPMTLKAIELAFKPDNAAENEPAIRPHLP